MSSGEEAATIGKRGPPTRHDVHGNKTVWIEEMQDPALDLKHSLFSSVQGQNIEN